MSLQDFQSALAYVLRCFNHEQESITIKKLSERYTLSPNEVFMLDEVIHQQRLKGYSEELFKARWTIIREALEFLQPLIDLYELSNLWESDFDKKSINVINEDLTLRFVEYLAYDPSGYAFISANPNKFLPCLIRYVHCVFTFRHNYLPRHRILPNSLLTDRYFKILELSYDVREYFAALAEHIDNKLPSPPKRPVILLFIADDAVTEFRSFEIDKTLRDFLAIQLNEPPGHPSLPTCYEELTDLGLCRPLVEKPCCAHH